MMTESIVPIQKENEGIRSEIRLLAETMKHGFEKMDQKLDFTRKNLEMQIASTHQQIASTRENLETQIKANDKQLILVQKLLWLVLTLVLGLFAKAVHLF
jgi:phosphoglycerate-specific signal transduction histidine kinase